MKNVTIVSDQVKAEMAFAEMIFGTGKAPSFEGKLLAVNPVASEFATYDPNFKMAVEEMHEPTDIIDGVVYYDNGADRAYIVPAEVVEITEVN
jgi:hypothetical protein